MRAAQRSEHAAWHLLVDGALRAGDPPAAIHERQPRGRSERRRPVIKSTDHNVRLVPPAHVAIVAEGSDSYGDPRCFRWRSPS